MQRCNFSEDTFDHFADVLIVGDGNWAGFCGTVCSAGAVRDVEVQKWWGSIRLDEVGKFFCLPQHNQR